jgi:RimJ/RimL family protein N-acetyltransferase
VDDSRRGRGYGRRMLELGLEYAFKILKARRVSIGVLKNNEPAYKCYKSLGFTEAKQDMYRTSTFKGKEWRVIELEKFSL